MHLIEQCLTAEISTCRSFLGLVDRDQESFFDKNIGSFNCKDFQLTYLNILLAVLVNGRV